MPIALPTHLPPDLPPAYTPALHAALDFIITTFAPVGVLVSGSIVRGNPDPGSDFDIHVIWAREGRRRIQRHFDGVPAEIFINSPAWIRQYLQEEDASGRPGTAHMFATGWVCLDQTGIVAELVSASRLSLQQGWQASPLELQQMRYLAATLFEDAAECATRDPATATLLLSAAIDAGLRHWFATRQRFLPRPKERLAVLGSEAPDLYRHLIRALAAHGHAGMAADILALAQALIGEQGFFCWDSADY